MESVYILFYLTFLRAYFCTFTFGTFSLLLSKESEYNSFWDQDSAESKNQVAGVRVEQISIGTIKRLEEKWIPSPGNYFFSKNKEKVIITQSESIPTLNVFKFSCLGKNFNSFYLWKLWNEMSFHLFFLKEYLRWTYENRIKNIQMCVLMKIGSWSFSCVEFV